MNYFLTQPREEDAIIDGTLPAGGQSRWHIMKKTLNPDPSCIPAQSSQLSIADHKKFQPGFFTDSSVGSTVSVNKHFPGNVHHLFQHDLRYPGQVVAHFHQWRVPASPKLPL